MSEACNGSGSIIVTVEAIKIMKAMMIIKLSIMKLIIIVIIMMILIMSMKTLVAMMMMMMMIYMMMVIVMMMIKIYDENDLGR